MGMAGLRELAQLRHTSPAGSPRIVVLARDRAVNRRKLASFIADGVEVIWGDLMNPEDVERGVADADVVLHVGGMVSPQADWQPELTYRVNVTAMRHVIDAALRRQSEGKEVKVVYIGSVSQYGNRPEGVHWGRTVILCRWPLTTDTLSPNAKPSVCSPSPGCAVGYRSVRQVSCIPAY